MRSFLVFTAVLGFGALYSCQNSVQVSEPQESIFLRDWKKKSIIIPRSVPKDLEHIDSPRFTVSVDYNEKRRKVSKYISGINATTYTGDYLHDKSLIKNVTNLNPSVIRFPGGDASNMYFFNTLPGDLPKSVKTYSGEWTDFSNGSEDLNWKMNTEKYYAFLDSVGAEGIITVNYPYARYGTSQNPVSRAASLAADWVRHDNGRTRFWEVGNETYACWEGGFRIDTLLNKDGQPEYINGELYGEHFRVFADSMRKAALEIGVEIYIGAVFADAEDVWDGSGKNITKNWNNLLAPELRRVDGGNYADFISVHSYFLNKGEKSPAEIISTSQSVPIELQDYIHSCLDSAEVSRVPLALTEWNIKEPHQTSQAGALQAVSTALSLNDLGFGASCYFALKDYWRGKEGDFGMFSNNDPELGQSVPYPTFYHFYYLNKTLGDEMVSTNVTPKNDDLLCYSSSFSDGGLGIVIINKSSDPQSFRVDIANYSPQSEFSWYELSRAEKDNIWSEKLEINGVSNLEASKGGPSKEYMDIPAWRTEGNEQIALEIEGLSAIYLLVM